MNLAKIKIVVVTILLLGQTTALLIERQLSSKLRLELAALQTQVDDLKARSALDDSNGSTKVNADELTRLRAEHSELLRLRGEVSRLRSVQAEVVKLQTENTRLRTNQQGSARPQEPVDEAKEALKAAVKSAGIARLKYGRAWGIATIAFAQANGDRMPETFEQAAAHYPKELLADLANFAPDAFEFVFRGSLKEITKPAMTIILRETKPVANEWQPGFFRTYVFADGHAEIKSTPDGNFEQWEKDRMMPIQQR